MGRSSEINLGAKGSGIIGKPCSRFSFQFLECPTAALQDNLKISTLIGAIEQTI
jgi:hypothetical protein